MMKKVLALILTLVMVFAMGSVAFAETVSTDGGTSTGDVMVAVVPFADEVYSVEIAWESLTTFTYKFTDWDEQNHEYTGGWTKNPTNEQVADTASTNIAVTNNSNVAITVTAAFDEGPNVTDRGMIATLSTAALNLEVGSDGNLVVTVSGEPTENNADIEEFAIGTITVTIDKKDS